MITLRIEEILKERGISKTQFADMMGVTKQNVNLLLNTTNTQKMEKMAEALEVKNAQMMWPVRIAVAGKAVTPGGAVEICRILGQKETVRRLKLAMDKLRAI